MTNLKDGILYNVENCIALSGDGKVDGSKRISIDPDTNTPIVEKLIDGIWQPASFEFGPDTVWIGKAAGLAAAGHHILTENVDGEFHLIPHSDFNGETSQSDTKTLFSYYFSQNQISQPDYSNEWIGASFSWTAQSDTSGLLKKGYWKTGSVAATKPVTIKSYEGTDENGVIVFDQTYPASQFPANSEIETIEKGFIELSPGLDIYTEITSDENFSLLTNAAEIEPWNAIDICIVRYDNLLQTAEWVDGATYTKDESWFIDNRRIYACNVTGIQTGTFANNSDKWDSLLSSYTETDPIFSASPSFDIESQDIANWDTAYSWGDHSTEGYLKAETDPVFLSQKGALNGVATLDGLGKIPVSQLPSSVMEYKGAWNATTNTPTLTDGTGDNGDVYKCSVAGTQDFGSGDITFNVSDWVVYNGTIWERSPNSDVETDPIFTAWDRSTGISITESQISDLSHFSGAIADLTGSGPLQFPSATGQKINLYSDTYAIGVESGQLRISSNQDISFRTGGYSGDERAFLSEVGTFKVPYRVQTPIIYNDNGILKLQPYAGYDVEVFSDTDVGDADNGKIFKIWRKAPEGNDYIRFYVSAGRKAYIHASRELTLQAQNPFTINSVTEDIFFKVGDNAGVKKFHFRDSDNNDVVTIDSNGLLNIDANMGGSLKVIRGSNNSIDTFMDATYTDIRFGGAKDDNRIGTWIDKPFQIVTNSLGRIIVDEYGRVDIPSSLTVSDLEATDDIIAYGDISARNHDVRSALVFNNKSTQIEAGERHFSQGHTHTAVYNNDWYDASSENISERDIHFSPDGLMMYIIGLASGGTGDCSIWEYQLTTPWDLSTVGTPTIESIETYGPNQVGLFIDIDGRRLWTVCTSNDTVIEYSMSPFNISSLTWVQAKDISGQESSPSAVFWSANGDRLFIAGDGDNDIVAFSITNEWDISGISWFEDFGTDIDAPTGLHFSSDGRRMYVMDGSAEDDIHEFHLSDPWRIGTARLVNLFDVNAENSSPQGIFIVQDNSKIFMVGTGTPDGVYGYDLGLEVDGLILADGGLTVGGIARMNNLPTSDPLDTGVLWNNSGSVMVSAG